MPQPAPLLKLNSSALIPQVGLGTWPMDNTEVAQAVETAVDLGYRHFDTAENYGNEEGVGEGIRRSGIERSTVFITTKFNVEWHSYDGVRKAFENSTRKLGTDYIDLLLIHWPNPGEDRYVDAFRGLAALRDEGLVKAAGVSNFKPAHLQRLFDAGLVPDVNQVQLDPFRPRLDVRAANASHGVLTEAWSPLGGSSREVLSVPLVSSLADKYGKTPAQIVLRWDVQNGLITIPKSGNPERMAQNLDIFDFVLEEGEMQELSGLANAGARISDSDVFGH